MQGDGIVKEGPMEITPSTVPRETAARQGGEVRARWAWTEPTVWTERMLTALEQGVKGGVWFSLMDKVYAPANLAAAFEKATAPYFPRSTAGCACGCGPFCANAANAKDVDVAPTINAGPTDTSPTRGCYA